MNAKYGCGIELKKGTPITGEIIERLKAKMVRAGANWDKTSLFFQDVHRVMPDPLNPDNELGEFTVITAASEE